MMNIFICREYKTSDFEVLKDLYVKIRCLFSVNSYLLSMTEF